jgi:hypothetical protein
MDTFQLIDHYGNFAHMEFDFNTYEEAESYMYDNDMQNDYVITQNNESNILDN